MNIFETDNISLINGDCIEIMDELINRNIKVNKVITSPPYNIIRPSSTDKGYDLYKDGMANNEYIDWTISIFERYGKLLEKNGAIMYNLSYGTENTEVMNLTVAEIIKRTNFRKTQNSREKIIQPENVQRRIVRGRIPLLFRTAGSHFCSTGNNPIAI